MDVLHNLAIGFSEALSLTNVLYCFVGVLLGTLIGVLPGLGPPATIAMLLPITFTLEPATALIMLAGIYYGAQYGGSTTAILVNLPGEQSSVVTALDGYQMALRGKAGLALSTAAFGSFFAGCTATLLIALAAPLLADLARQFHAADYFSLTLLGLVASIALSQGSFLKALAMIILGLIVGIVGIDVTSGTYRMTFGIPELLDGVPIVAVAMGLFGLSEIIENLAAPSRDRLVNRPKLTAGALPNGREVRQMIMPILRGTGLGSVLGVLPGGGAILSSFVAYAVEKRISPTPERFGKGAIEGVAAPEAANNAGAQTSFIPMLTLGIPANPVMALMIGAMLIQGIQPGPGVMNEQPALFWGLIASMWIGNLMLVILNVPLIGIWTRLLTVPYKYMYPAIITFCAIGVFTLNFSTFDLFIMVAFGLLGFLFRRLACEPAPFLLGMVLGPMMEEYLRRAMMLSRQDPLVFVERPISATLLAVAGLCIVLVALPAARRGRQQAFQD